MPQKATSAPQGGDRKARAGAERGAGERRGPSRGSSRGGRHRAHVVGVLRRDDGRRLMELRPEAGGAGGRWAHPGGKIERGENADAALRRELEEEIGIALRGALPLGSCRVVDGAATVHLTVFLCTEWDGEPQPRYGQTLAWLSEDEARPLPQLPGVEPVEELVRRHRDAEQHRRAR